MNICYKTYRYEKIGYSIVTYEKEGKDRAAYGGKTLKTRSPKLSETGLKGFSDRNLRLYRQFYLEYPEIWQLLTAKFQATDNQVNTIWQLGIAKYTGIVPNAPATDKIPAEKLIVKLTYTHFIKLMKIAEPLKRTLYELQTIQNNWNVKQLQRNINSLLFERIGLSTDKKGMLAKLKN